MNWSVVKSVSQEFHYCLVSATITRRTLWLFYPVASHSMLYHDLKRSFAPILLRLMTQRMNQVAEGGPSTQNRTRLLKLNICGWRHGDLNCMSQHVSSFYFWVLFRLKRRKRVIPTSPRCRNVGGQDIKPEIKLGFITVAMTLSYSKSSKYPFCCEHFYVGV